MTDMSECDQRQSEVGKQHCERRRRTIGAWSALIMLPTIFLLGFVLSGGLNKEWYEPIAEPFKSIIFWDSGFLDCVRHRILLD